MLEQDGEHSIVRTYPGTWSYYSVGTRQHYRYLHKTKNRVGGRLFLNSCRYPIEPRRSISGEVMRGEFYRKAPGF